MVERDFLEERKRERQRSGVGQTGDRREKGGRVGVKERENKRRTGS